MNADENLRETLTTAMFESARQRNIRVMATGEADPVQAISALSRHLADAILPIVEAHAADVAAAARADLAAAIEALCDGYQAEADFSGLSSTDAFELLDNLRAVLAEHGTALEVLTPFFGDSCGEFATWTEGGSQKTASGPCQLEAGHDGPHDPFGRSDPSVDETPALRSEADVRALLMPSPVVAARHEKWLAAAVEALCVEWTRHKRGEFWKEYVDELRAAEHGTAQADVKREAAAAARAEDRMGTIDGENCHRCGGENVVWAAPSPLWNLVMRGDDINGDPRHDDLVCMRCFVVLADEAGVSGQWRLCLADEPDGLVKVTPSGRVWNPETWMWDEPGETPPARADLTAAVEALCDDADDPNLMLTFRGLVDTAKLRAVLAESRGESDE